jgi:photosystem II stability/assembly factor-like uncharacterized protein
LNDVCFYDKNKGWAAADSGYIMLTTDAGYTWEEKHIGTDDRLFGICFYDQNTGWVAGNHGTIMQSTDGGSSWTAQQSGTGNALKDICFTDASNGWAVGNGSTILHTNDGGNNWIIDSTGGNLYLRSVCFVDSENGWIAGGDAILHTADGGTTWEDQYNGSSNYYGIYFTDLNNGWAVGGHGAIMRTTDGGVTWGNDCTSNPLHATSALEDVFFTDPMNGWAVGWHSGGVFGSPSGDLLLYTNDGGDNWEDVSFPTYNGLNGVTAIDPENAWIVGDGGLIISALDFIVDVKDDSPFNDQQGVDNAEFLSMIIHPNPCSKATLLRYQIPVTRHASRVTRIDLYDISGVRIKRLMNEVKMPGEYEMEIDVSNLSAGLYFIRLQAGNRLAVEKLIVK